MGFGLFGGRDPDAVKVKVSTLQLYDELYAASMASNNSSTAPYIHTANDEFSADFNGMYCNERISYYYMLDNLPRYLSIRFKDEIRVLCRKNVRISFLNLVRPHKIEWESPQMKSKLRILARLGKEKDEARGEVNAYNMHLNLGSMQSQEWIESSLSYLSEADISRKRALVKSSLVMVVTGERGEDFDMTVKDIVDYTNHIGLKLTRVLYNIPDWVRGYSPFNRSIVDGITDMMPSNVITDEIVARYSTYSQGILGASGMYFGTDIYSGFPVLKRVKAGAADAENWLITAETGGGKSFYIKFLLLQLLAAGFNGTIMDIEGREYKTVGEFMAKSSRVEIINMAEGSGSYFDPVEIAPPLGIPDIDKDAKTMSVNFTLAMLKVLLGKPYANNDWLDTVIDDAVQLVYTEVGITEDMKTWVRSTNLTLFNVYARLKTMKNYRSIPAYGEAVEKAIAVLSRYFEPNGTRSSLFTKRVRVTDVAEADLVICSFGMEGRAESSVDPVQLALMQLGAAQFSHQRSIFSKARGKFNFKIWEEFQRWGGFPDSEKTIGVAVTGGRKLGDVNIIITNNVADILRNDRFKIFGNIQSFVVGAISDSAVRTQLLERLTVPNMLPELDKISAAAITKDKEDGKDGKSSLESPYRHAFLCGLDRNKYGIVKVIVPEVLASTLLYAGVEEDKHKAAQEGEGK